MTTVRTAVVEAEYRMHCMYRLTAVDSYDMQMHVLCCTGALQAVYSSIRSLCTFSIQQGDISHFYFRLPVPHNIT